MKSLNQLYKESGAQCPFKAWLQKGQEIFNKKKEEGVIGENISFDQWANEVNNIQLNVDETGTAATSSKKKKSKFGAILKDVAKAGVKIAAGVMANQEKQNAQPKVEEPVVESDPKEKPKKTILGLKPVVFYSITAVTILAVGFGVYKIIQSRKS